MNWFHPFSAFFIQGVVWPFAYPILKLYFGLTITGRENIAEAQKIQAETACKKHKKRVGILFVSNHVSEIDFAVIIAGIKPYNPLFPLYFVGDTSRRYDDDSFGWRKYFYRSGLFLRLCGVFAAVRGTGDYEKALVTHIKMLRDGRSVCIFPQGGYSVASGEIHGGAGYLAEATHAIVVPVTIKHQDGKNYEVHFGVPLRNDDLVSTKDAGSGKYREISKKILSAAL